MTGRRAFLGWDLGVVGETGEDGEAFGSADDVVVGEMEGVRTGGEEVHGAGVGGRGGERSGGERGGVRGGGEGSGREGLLLGRREESVGGEEEGLWEEGQVGLVGGGEGGGRSGSGGGSWHRRSVPGATQIRVQASRLQIDISSGPLLIKGKTKTAMSMLFTV